MKTLFFSVDVETSGPNPAVADLLTLGAVPVLENGTVTADRFYTRISYGGRALLWEEECRLWWHSDKVSDEARRAAFGILEDDLEVSFAQDAAQHLEAWVQRQLTKHGAKEPCFVAHPVAFDWQWVDALMWRHLGRNVFGYKGLCLRSFGFGLAQRPWNEDRTDDLDLYVPSTLPHHALHDAVAQAEQLSRMLKLRATRARLLDRYAGALVLPTGRYR